MTVPAASPSADAADSALRQRRGEQLFKDHERSLRRHVRRRDPALADDVVAETFATAWRRLDEIPHGFEYPWLCVTADNLLRNQWRGQRRRLALTDALESVSPLAHDPSELPVVGEAMRGLPSRERALLTMTGLEGLSTGEAADRLGIAPGTARNALVGARRQLAVRLAALGVVVASVLLAFFYASAADSKGRRAPEVLAESLRSAGTVRQGATVHSEGGRVRHYDVVTDTASREQHVDLPGGRMALSQDGAPLTVVPERGETPAQTRRIERRFADDLRALDAAAPEQIQALIDAARRAGSSEAGPLIDGKPTTQITGVVRDRAGRRREVELLVAVEAPVVLRMRTRLAGSGDRWVTVDFERWQALRRRTPTPLAATPGLSAGASAPAAASGGSQPAPAAEPQAKLEAADGGNRRAAATALRAPALPIPPADPVSEAKFDLTRAPGRSEITRGRTDPRTPTAPVLPPAYTGPAGAILHTRTARVVDEREESQLEMWVELGGGERVRTLGTFWPRQAGAAGKVWKSWRTPMLELHIPEPEPNEPATLTIGCAPQTPQLVVDGQREVAAAAAAREAYAAGAPTRSGTPWADPAGAAEVPTVLVDSPLSFAPDVFNELTVRTDNGAVVSAVMHGGKLGRSRTPVRYEVWEVIPAGGPGDVLNETVPPDAVLTRCAK